MSEISFVVDNGYLKVTELNSRKIKNRDNSVRWVDFEDTYIYLLSDLKESRNYLKSGTTKNFVMPYPRRMPDGMISAYKLGEKKHNLLKCVIISRVDTEFSSDGTWVVEYWTNKKYGSEMFFGYDKALNRTNLLLSEYNTGIKIE